MYGRVDRRRFLAGVFAGAATVAAVAPLRAGARRQAGGVITFSDWLSASREQRAAALQGCLDRIAARDGDLRAWVQVAPQPATGAGALDGIPFGAKDIIETRGLSTAYGSPVYRGRIGTEDAAIVRDLRRQGAVLLGKTQTTAFAYRTPAPTRNPRDPAHTPGGSSAGSAAAVAADMVPLALGTQTRGSVLRPASYCGVTGFKPTYGRFPLDGVLPLAAGLDTLGFFTHTPADMLAFWQAFGQPMAGESDAAGVVFGVPDPLPEVEPAMAEAFGRAVAALRRQGARVATVDIAALIAGLAEASNQVQAFEAARHHRARYEEHGDALAELADLVRTGLAMPASQYERARAVIAEGRTRMAAIYADTPIVLVPAATGPAPRGYTNTGDPRLNAPFTALATPAVSVPMPVGTALPLGLQVTAAPGQDARLLRVAVRVFDRIHA